ncbi:hypothetical protein [Hydrogenimonas sp.]
MIKTFDRVYPDRKNFFEYLKKDKRKFLETFAKDLQWPMDLETTMKRKELISTLFGDERILYRIDWQK